VATGAAQGRAPALNACLFQRDAYASKAIVPSSSQRGYRTVVLTVVATGERLVVRNHPDGTFQLNDHPDLPRFR
jgi:hypothetical protein